MLLSNTHTMLLHYTDYNTEISYATAAKGDEDNCGIHALHGFPT